MPRSAKTLCGFFMLLALAAVGWDIYTWQNSADHPFSFAALGFLTKTYLAEYHQMTVDILTPEVFNQVLTPVLAIPAFFLCLGLAGVSLAGGVVALIVSKTSSGSMGPKDKSFKYNRR